MVRIPYVSQVVGKYLLQEAHGSYGYNDQLMGNHQATAMPPSSYSYARC